MTSRQRLSKSRLVAYRQCAKRLWLQTYRRELAQQSEAVLNRMAQGHMVGTAAQRLFPEGRLTREDHLRIWRATTNGEAELSPGAAAKLAALPWPRYFLDFETVGPAVPLWPGTRPYRKIPMQWSCHRQEADGTITSLPPFLDTQGEDPRRAFAERLVTAIGDTGPIMVYNAGFERSVLLSLADAFPALAPALSALADRLFDLLPFVRAHYYHPAMMGSWSIKRVLPTIAPDLDYANLNGVQSGDMVEPAYFEMIDPATPPERRKVLEQALLTYCERDTLAMVRVADRAVGRSSSPSGVVSAMSW